MTLLPFPEYAPDLSPFMVNESSTINNVLPRKDGYGPIPSPAVYSSALPAACRGVFRSRNADGSITVFAATSTRLWKLNNTDFTWIPISKVIALTGISNATPAVLSLNSHGLSIGDAIVLSTSGGLPTGLVVGTVYYVIAAGFTANAFEVSLTAGGVAINTSSAGSGTHSFTGYYTALPTADQWQFVQFNNFVIAVQINTAPQVYDLTASTAFADLAGSPPQARYIAIVNRFVILSGLGSSTPYRIQWSGLNATTTWTSGVNSSDFQDLPDGGIVRSIGGGETGTIMQDAAIRRMVYAPGSPVIFQIDRVAFDQGIYAPLSLVRGGDRLFYVGSDGFKMIIPGGYPQPIGKEKVDRTFFADVDSSALQLLQGAYEPRSTRVYFAYKSTSGAGTAVFDKVLIYDYGIERWSIATGIMGEYITNLARPNITLEGMDSLNGSIDALTFSLDDIANVTSEYISAFDSSHRLNFITGTPLEATLDTSEQELDGRRMRVKGIRPITDATTCYGSVGARENTQATVSYSAEQVVDSKGLCPANVSTRLARGRLRIPAATLWSFATGVEPMAAPEGKR